MTEKKNKRSKNSKFDAHADAKAKMKKKRTMSDDLKYEIEGLHDAIAVLHEDLKKMAPPRGLRKVGGSLANGIFKGLGFIIGTTLIAGLMIWGAQKALTSPVVQNWLTDKITSIVSDSVENALPDIEIPKK